MEVGDFPRKMIDTVDFAGKGGEFPRIWAFLSMVWEWF